MKRLFKYASGLALAGLLSVAFVSTASAQHRGGGVRVGVGGFRSVAGEARKQRGCLIAGRVEVSE